VLYGTTNAGSNGVESSGKGMVYSTKSIQGGIQ